MKKSLYLSALLVTFSSAAYADCSSLTCNSVGCASPNAMQSCLQNCDYPKDITNCVGENKEIALKVCSSGGGQTGNQKENCRRIQCIFQK